jgi:hypothetical protein
LIKAGLFGYGILISLAGLPIHRHYLVIAFPLEWLWLSWQAHQVDRRPNLILWAMWFFELLISALFLAFIHTNQGAPSGDYGVPYIHQR